MPRDRRGWGTDNVNQKSRQNGLMEKESESGTNDG